jgi:hypothetical protein
MTKNQKYAVTKYNNFITRYNISKAFLLFAMKFYNTISVLVS